MESRWWHVAVCAMAVTLVGTAIGQPNFAALAAVAAALVASWFLIGRHAHHSHSAAITFTVLVIVLFGLGTAIHPLFAIAQFLGYPLMWTLPRTLRGSIIANVALALSIGVGFLFSSGTTPDDLAQTAFTVTFSLGFSLAFGLWFYRTATESEERKALLDELTATQEQLSALSRDAGITAERERLAREIHDTIAQDLTGMVMLAERARLEPDAAARAVQLEQLESAARDALAETRTLVAASAPTSLDAGLSAALQRLAERYSRDTGITVTASASDDVLDRDSQVVVLRCAQEGLANVRKHSGARSAHISLDGRTLTIRDDGHGFDPDAPAVGLGIAGMRERVAMVGGFLDIRSDASGTVLTVTLARQEVAR
ncbi:sensor histidine kinase [Diaminobutyricimonas sp. TR449]|uniref:sensor histidine kinase n=1 Tax=Diaminobutyricimonas sp. TR449 TaxID=2708076 RepID=UPI001422F207|nr:sensor histidine kinase [Diaminobutyricimonas sp. TR449]